jgi:hypothetical protein
MKERIKKGRNKGRKEGSNPRRDAVLREQRAGA